MNEPIRNLWAEVQEEKQKLKYKTPSPFPNQEVYYSAEGKLFVRNYSFSYGVSTSFHSQHVDYSPFDYFMSQTAILKYNNSINDNSDISIEVVKFALNGMIRWKGNEALLSMKEDVEEAIDYALDAFFNKGIDALPYIRKAGFQKKWWYSDEIESLTGKERSKRKVAARASINSMAIREEIKEVSDEYRENNFNVFPAMAHLEPNVDYTRPTIVKHGAGLYISTSENKFLRVKQIKANYPNKTQKEVADILGVDPRTVRLYWNK
ncbi:hypothetical protein [Marinilabilia salmonicolor]|nr:hypothetical protein [Marinilabilia salmonicolor]